MKTLNTKSLICVILMGALALGLGISASAQVLAAQVDDKEIPLSEFNSIYVGDSFEITLVRGEYGMKLTVDKELAPYVEKYVKSRTLNLSYDSKSVPKEIKKLYRGRNALAPVFRAVIYLPELESITLLDNATLTGADTFYSDKFSLIIGDKAIVKSLTVDARSAYVSARKNSQAVLDIHAEGPAEIAAEGNSNIKLSLRAEETAITTAGYSQVSVMGDCRSINISSSSSSQLSISNKGEKLAVSAEGFAKLSLSGEAEKMVLKTSRSSKLDALSLQLEELEASMAGNSEANVNVEKLLDVNLTGGSCLYYSGSPEFKIGKIIKSTLAPYGTQR